MKKLSRWYLTLGVKKPFYQHGINVLILEVKYSTENLNTNNTNQFYERLKKLLNDLQGLSFHVRLFVNSDSRCHVKW